MITDREIEFKVKEMSHKDYWCEAIGVALDDAGKSHLFSASEIKELGETLSVYAECESQALGYDVADRNLVSSKEQEFIDLKKELERERKMITCCECKGSGEIVIRGPYHHSSSHCHICNGRGRRDP